MSSHPLEKNWVAMYIWMDIRIIPSFNDITSIRVMTRLAQRG